MLVSCKKYGIKIPTSLNKQLCLDCAKACGYSIGGKPGDWPHYEPKRDSFGMILDDFSDPDLR